MTALSPFTRPRPLRQFAVLAALFGAAGGLAWHGAREAMSVPKPAIEHALRSLAKNAAWAERGLVQRMIASPDGTKPAVSLRYIHLPSLAPPRRDRPPLPPLVFLHDSPGSSSEWVNVIFGGEGAADTLFEGLREAMNPIYALELPGHGVAPEGAAPMSSAELARVVAGALRAFGDGAAILIAAGRGGEVALRVAADEPELVAKLVLLSPSGLAPEPGTQLAADELDPEGYRRVDVEAVRARLAVQTYRAATQDEIAEALCVRRNARNWQTTALFAAAERDQPDRLAGHLPRVKQPVLLLFGGIDRLRPADSYGKRMAAALPQARLVVIDACGNRPHVEMPERVIKAIDGFR